MKAKAMVLVEPGRLELREFEVRPPAPDEILIKTRVTSVCSTDVKVLHGQVGAARYPVIMGHEFIGEIVDIGSEAAQRYPVKVGDRVTPEPYIPCGHCEWCRTEHHYHNCPNVQLYGISLICDRPPHLRGGYAEYVYLTAGTVLHKVAPNAPDLAASLSSVVGNGVRWIKTLGQMSFGQSLVISGAGSQGLCALAAAREAGVGPVVMLGLSSDRARFDLARTFGADHVVEVDRQDPLQAVPDLIGGPPDVVIETSGAPTAIRTAIQLVRRSGRVVSIGLSGGKQTSIAFDDLVWRDITLVCGKGQAGNVGDAVRLINSGRVPFEKINNFHYRLTELERALSDTEKPPAGFIKAAVVFN
ncbi:MAG: zinc-dependent alcohol dehydrogenase [Hyphomicrobiales bacterium]